MKVIEVNVPVPWGHIAAKLWGDIGNPAVLLLHGYLDNCGSFDRLINHLPSTHCYICVDLPGHGRSSHFTQMAQVYFIYYLSAVRLVLDHFKCSSYTIISHSFGAMVAIMFAQIYPEIVSKLVVIDAVYMTTTSTYLLRNMIKYQHKGYEDYIKMINRTVKSPTHNGGMTYEVAFRKLMQNRQMGEINPDALKPIVERMIVPTGEDGKYKFSLDPRLKTFCLPFLDYQAVLDFVRECPIMCPTLFIIYTDVDIYKVYFSKLLRQFALNPLFTVKHVNGGHHMHTNQPEKIGPILTAFLLKTYSKL